MSRYIPEYSFIATLASVHPDYPAALDFSRITSELQVNTYHGPPIDVGSEEYDYLCLTSLPRDDQKFWFLYHEWDDGSTSYEIKAHHLMFYPEKRNFKSLIVSSRDYVVPYPYTSWAQGWRITWDDQCRCPPAAPKPGKFPFEVEPEALKTGKFGPIRLNSPNGKDLQVYGRRNFDHDWWAYVTDEDGVKIPLQMNILELGIQHPLA
jgi:hypothetical protein